ncbi:MAG: hypothetical protein ACYTCU_09310 [Planctomycetota bacterium]|jgi:hypothetical protein
MTTGERSYFDRISGWWKNVPVLVWIVVAAGVLAGVMGFLGVFKDAFGGLWEPGPADLVRISIRPPDPRFVSGGERMNWGGGSQALFVETGDATSDELDLRALAAGDDATPIWETMSLPRMTLLIDAIYDAPSGSPTCVIEEWGIEATPISGARRGHYVAYLTGGASGPRSYGECLITPAGGTSPITLWAAGEDEEDGFDMFASVQYLRSGEPLFFEIDVGRPEEGAREDAGGPGAFLVRVYARVRIGGETSVVQSSQAVRVVMPWSADQVVWREPPDGPPFDAVEDLRPRAYVEVAD